MPLPKRKGKLASSHSGWLGHASRESGRNSVRSQRALAIMREASSARATSDLAEIHGRGELARRESWQAGGNGQGWEVRADVLRGQEDQVTYLTEGRASENCRM